MRFSFCIILFSCFQEPPLARNVEVHTVVMENLPYIYRYLTIPVNKKQMPDLQTVLTALRHKLYLLEVAGKYLFQSVKSLN